MRIGTVTRSFAQLTRLEDEHDRIVIEIDHLTDALATALAARFGTEAIAVVPAASLIVVVVVLVLCRGIPAR